jgi:hypothetical protein
MIVALTFVITAVLIARKRKKNWLKRHKTFALTGVAASLVSFAIIFIGKSGAQFPHFHSPHAIAGAVALALLIITPTTGVLISFKFQTLRPLHRVLGRITSIAVLFTALMGLLRFLQLSKG